MVNHETNEVFFEDFEVPADNLIGEEGMGFRYILDGMNAERILIAAECIGDGYWFIDKARATPTSASCSTGRSARTRACSFRSRAPTPTCGGRPDALRGGAAVRRRPAGGAEANMAKLLAPTRRGKRPTSVCRLRRLRLRGEYDVERKFRETRLYQVAPISTNLILSYIGEHVLGMPRSF
jgi:acyl-CoA dehydrogenase